MGEFADKKMIHKSYPATKSKWYADIPLSIISHDFKDVTIQLQDFTIPRIFLGSDQISYKGVGIEVPAATFNPQGKTISFTYLIDERWESYLSLYQWANCYASIDNPTPLDKVRENEKKQSWWTIPIRVYLLNSYR